MNTSSKLKLRLTSLERFANQSKQDFQRQGVRYVQDAGYNAVLANGGSGFGPNMLSPEMFVASDVIPDLMPQTIQAASRELDRRITLLDEAGLDTWIGCWGVPGPNLPRDENASEFTQCLDRRTKLEMHAKFRRSPELFGAIDPKILTWRGSQPLCLSHPTVKEYYDDLFKKCMSRHTQIKGVLFFPGDNEPEICDQTCSRCRENPLSAWQRMIEHANRCFGAMRSVNPDVRWYFILWNLSGTMTHSDGIDIPKVILEKLDPEIGIAMSMNDVVVQTRSSWRITFEQPWPIVSEAGSLFQTTTQFAHKQNRSVIAIHEFSQSEIFDPVCHNVPLPAKTLKSLEILEDIPGVDGFLDFWGNHQPWLPHANHTVMNEYFLASTRVSDHSDLLENSCLSHYNLTSGDHSLINQALTCWCQLDDLMNRWPIATWGQRFSPGIGRNGARGFLYCPLVPPVLKRHKTTEGLEQISNKLGLTLPEIGSVVEQSESLFIPVAESFAELSNRLNHAEKNAGKATAWREGLTLKLMGSLIASQGRTLQAYACWLNGQDDSLKKIIQAECHARENQLNISAALHPSGGVHPDYVSEDIQNMRLFIADDDFPNTPDTLFHFTNDPYSSVMAELSLKKNHD